MLNTHDAGLAVLLVINHRLLQAALGESFQATLQNLQEGLDPDDLVSALKVVATLKNEHPESDHVLRRVAQDFLRDYPLDDLLKLE